MTVTPQQTISNTLNSSKIPLKSLTFTFGEIRFTLGKNGTKIRFTLGEIRFTLGDAEDLRASGILFLLLGGFWDSVGRGVLYGVLKEVTFISCYRTPGPQKGL